jgi:hypothetical protein
MAEVLLEFADPVSTADGGQYVARACGGEMAGGMWEGWVEFLPVDGGEPLCSARATTQPNRQDTLYWASGLTPIYLEGALRRTLEPAPIRTVPVRSTMPAFDGPAPHVDRPPAGGGSIVNPFSLYQKGEAYLRRRLSALSAWHLVNVIRAHGLSTEDAAVLNAQHPASLVELIVERMRSQTRA